MRYLVKLIKAEKGMVVARTEVRRNEFLCNGYKISVTQNEKFLKIYI